MTAATKNAILNKNDHTRRPRKPRKKTNKKKPNSDPDSIHCQLAWFHMLKEWKQPIKINDIDALKSRLRRAFGENNMAHPFMKIDMNSENYWSCTKSRDVFMESVTSNDRWTYCHINRNLSRCWQSVIHSCIRDNPDSIQFPWFHMLQEWNRPIKTNDLNALKSRVRHAFEFFFKSVLAWTNTHMTIKQEIEH